MAKTARTVDITIETSFYSVLSRVRQKLERVFSEFIDNSLQSFLEHRDLLSKIPDGGKCIVKIVWDAKGVTVIDNAFGMNFEDFSRALKLNTPKAQYSENSLGKYGMGLKYAAIYLGSYYTINSTEFGSKEQYTASMDIDNLKKTNASTVLCDVSDAPEEKHGTEIKIERLNEKFDAKKQRELVKKLGQIYNKFIAKGELAISINGINVEYIEPELRKDPINGHELMAYVSNGTFYFNSKVYEYNGWVGILNKASVDDAGLSLAQNDRVIELNYRNQDLFGKKNDFRYQRVVGSISFLGNNWTVSFNKDGLLWGDDGLEGAFIGSLKNNNPEIMLLFKMAKALRKDPPSIARTGETLAKAFEKLGAKEKPVLPTKAEKQSESSVEPVPTTVDDGKENQTQIDSANGGGSQKGLERSETIPEVKPTANTTTSVVDPKLQKQNDVIEISYESVDYSFKLVEKNDPNDKTWISLSRIDGDFYEICMNYAAPCLAAYQTKFQVHDLISKLAMSICISRLASVRLGLKLDDSDKMIQELNSIIWNLQ
jgi:hypothetical protein